MKKFVSVALAGAIILSAGVYCPAPNFLTVAEESVENPNFGTYENLTYYKSIDYITIMGCDNEATEVVIPEEIEGLPVTVIGNFAFYFCESLTSITIPDSVTIISNNAFIKCTSLKSITIPDTVTSIGVSAFDYCSNLTSIVIPDSVTEIGDNVFGDCSSLESITIPASLSGFNSGCFRGTPWLENKKKENPLVVINDVLIDGTTCRGDIVVPDSVAEIGSGAFMNCTDVTSVIVPDSVTKIGGLAFVSCSNLKSITIENPDCEIIGDGSTICDSQVYNLGNTAEIVFNGTIYGYPDSTAQAYAEKYGYKFAPIGGQPPTEETETLKGDANLDGDVTIADSVAILQYLANGDEYALSEKAEKNADCCNVGDGVNTEDALAVQKLDAKVISDLPVESE